MLKTISFLTDFGSRDWYVAAMKGVVLRLTGSNQTTFLDISHDIPPGSVQAASFVLNEVYDSLPNGSIVVAVVDPTVGSTRKISIVFDQVTDKYLVGPANGIFNLVCRVRQDPSRFGLYQFTNETAKGWLAPYQEFLGNSSTFHGRDIFAPLGALLGLGKLKLDGVSGIQLLPVITENAPEIFDAKAIKSGLKLTCMYTDRFGNLFFNVRGAPLLGELRFKKVHGDSVFTARFGRTFADVPEKELVAYPGSGGWLEVALRNDSAQQKLDICMGSGIVVV